MSTSCAALLEGYTSAVERTCRQFADGADPHARDVLLRWSAGMVLLSRLQGERRRESGFRRVVRALSKRSDAEPEAAIRGLLQGWYQAAGTLSRYRLRKRVLTVERQRLEAALPTGGMTPGERLTGEIRRFLQVRESLGEAPCSGTDRVRRDDEPVRSLLQESGDPGTIRALFLRQWCRDLEHSLVRLGADGEESARTALHTTARDISALDAALRLRCLPDRGLLPRLVRQALVSVLLHLRHLPADWPRGSRRLLLSLLILIIENLSSGSMCSGATARCHAALRQNGRLLARWRGEAVQPGACLRQLAWQEIRHELAGLARGLRGGEGTGTVDLTVSLARCHRTLYMAGEPALAWWADGLQQAIVARRQLGRPVNRHWRAGLRAFREAVLSGRECLPLTDRLLDVLARESRDVLTATSVPAVGWRDPAHERGVAEPGRQPSGTAIGQLSAGLDCLADLQRVRDAWEAGRIPEILQELSMLERGAAVLGVRRVQTVAAVLLALYRRLTEPGAAAPVDPALMPVLRRGHAGLLHRLDQAAAWQPVSRPQPLVEYLHRHLEAGPLPAQRLTPQRRCLDINRRLQALLAGEERFGGAVMVPPAGDATGQHTVLRSLLRDQARLLAVLCRDGEGRR